MQAVTETMVVITMTVEEAGDIVSELEDKSLRENGALLGLLALVSALVD
jgi:hypothetical protein